MKRKPNKRITWFDALLTPRGNTWSARVGRVRPKRESSQRGTVAMLEAFVDAPSRHKNLTVFPVIAPPGPGLHYLLSTEIQGDDVLTLRERGDDTTHMLLARNNSYHDLLLLAGEPLPGESQGRRAGRSFVLGGKSVTQLPVSSVERGGWPTSDQESEITEWVESFPIQKQQVGLLACLGPQILGLEAVGCPELYKPLHRRLLIRFIKETISSQGAGSNGGGDTDLGVLEMEARKLVTSLENAGRVETKRIGAGDYLKLTGPVTGGELVHQGTLLHLSVRPEPVQHWAASGKEG